MQAGKLTEATLRHRAAQMTLKLVNAPGGEALANTSFTVLTPGGDVIKESIGAFPRVILAEGEYRAIARNEGRVFEREFKVTTGVDGEDRATANAADAMLARTTVGRNSISRRERSDNLPRSLSA